MGSPVVRLSPSPDVPSATTADLDALGTCAESHFGDFAARYSHADWAREQQAEPARHAAMRYIAFGRPPALPDEFFSCFPSHQRPSFSEIQERPVISMPLPEGPGIAVSVDYVGPLPATPRGNTYALIFTNRFRRQSDMYVVTARLPFLSTGTPPFGDTRAAYARTTASSYAQRFRRRSTNFLGFGKLPPAPTTQIAMAEWSV